MSVEVSTLCAHSRLDVLTLDLAEHCFVILIAEL